MPLRGKRPAGDPQPPVVPRSLHAAQHRHPRLTRPVGTDPRGADRETAKWPRITAFDAAGVLEVQR